MRRAIEEHLGSRQVARVIYGSVIVLTLIASLKARPPTDAVMVGTILATAVTVGLAELYSDVVGREVSTRRRATWAEVRSQLPDVVAVTFGVAFPVIFFVLALVGVLETATAFKVAKWTGLGLVGFYGFCAGRLTGRGLGGSLVHAAVVCAIGGIVIVFKALVHH